MLTVADFLTRLFWITLAVAVVVIFSTESVGVRWVIASALLLLALLPIYCNWLIVILSFRTTGPRPSMVPLFGGALAAIAIGRLPVESWNRWWWVALIADQYRGDARHGDPSDLARHAPSRSFCSRDLSHFPLCIFAPLPLCPFSPD